MSKLDSKDSKTWTAENIAEHQKEIDAKYPSPEERANAVFSYFSTLIDNKITTWDLMCFCAEYIAYLSQTYTELNPVARELIKQVYQHHYFFLDLESENGIRLKQILDTKSEQPSTPISNDKG
jgi:hypothetical protein